MLRQPKIISDGQGGQKPAQLTQGEDPFADDRTVWAEFRKPSFKNVAAAGTMVGEMNQLISIWRYDAVCRGWQVVYGKRKFKVLDTFNPDKQTTILVCQGRMTGIG